MNQNNDQLEEKTDNDRPEAELESSFRSSYRQTYTNLKTYWGGDQQLTDSTSSDGWAASTNAASSPNALNAALSASSASNKIMPATGSNPAETAANASTAGHSETAVVREKPIPPAGTHAPHHPWHLGSGGKRKPAGIKQKLPNDEPVPMFGDELKAATAGVANMTNGMPPPAEGEVRHLGGRGIPYSVDGANGQANLDVLKKIAAQPTAGTHQVAPPHFGAPESYHPPQSAVPHQPAQSAVPHQPMRSAAPHQQQQSAAPHQPLQSAAPHQPLQSADPRQSPQSAAPQIVTPGAPPTPVPPSEAPLLGDHEDLEQGTDLYAPTIEVITPPIAKEEFNDEPFDESVAHLYLPTADVSKPVIPQSEMLTSGEPSTSGNVSKQTNMNSPANLETPAPRPAPPASGSRTPVGEPLPQDASPSSGPSLPNLPKHTSMTSEPNSIARPLNIPTPSSVPSEDSLKAEQWENVPRSKRPKLNSYIDRQLGKDVTEQSEPETDDADDTSIQKRGSSPAKGILIGSAVVVAIAVCGFLFVTLTKGGGGGMPSFSSDSWKPLAAEADTAITSGEYASAITTLDKAIKLNPNVAELFHKRGLAKLQSHNRATYDSALQDLNVAINKDPKLLEAVLDRAAVRIELGQFQEAINDYDQLIKAGKDTDKVLYGRGLAKYYAGDYAEAQSEFEKVLASDSSNVQASIALGTTLYKSKSDREGAEKKFADATKDDASGLALRNRAILAYEQGPTGYEAAHKFYSDAIAANPKDANLYNERGIVHWMQKDPLAAASDFKAAVERDPNLESAQKNLSHVSKITGSGGTDAVLKLLDGDWKGSAAAANKLIADKTLSGSEIVRAILTKWVATHYQNRGVLAGEVLRTAQKPAAGIPWQSTLVKYLVGDINFETALKAANTQAEKTDLNYYGAIKDLFDLKKPDEASKKLKWVLDKGLTTSTEYALAKKSVEWMKQDQGESEE